MTQLLIGLGVGLGGVVAVVIALTLALRAEQRASERAFERAANYAARLDVAHADHALLATANVTLTTNLNELKRELELKQRTIAELGASVASVEKARDDLLHALQNNPGAVTTAVSTAFARLREQVSRAQIATAAAAAGDSRGGEDGGVHEAADDDASR